MKRIKPSNNNYEVKSVECRKRDLVIRIADWHRTKDSPTWDVETYVGGVYSRAHSSQFEKKQDAIAFANKMTTELL
jgi:hypothetical protein